MKGYANMFWVIKRTFSNHVLGAQKDRFVEIITKYMLCQCVCDSLCCEHPESSQ